MSNSSVTLWTVASQAPLSTGFPRQESWSGLPFPSPGALPSAGIELAASASQADSLPLHHLGSLGWGLTKRGLLWLQLACTLLPSMAADADPASRASFGFFSGSNQSPSLGSYSIHHWFTSHDGYSKGAVMHQEIRGCCHQSQHCPDGPSHFFISLSSHSKSGVYVNTWVTGLWPCYKGGWKAIIQQAQHLS